MFDKSAVVIAAFSSTIFLSVTSFTFVAPLLVALAQEFGTTVPVVGQLTAATAIPWGLVAPIIGPLSDRYGRRPLLLAGSFGMGLTTAAAAFAQDLPTLLVLRFLTGCAGAATSPSVMASTADMFQGPARARAYGWVHGGFAFAALVGVPLAAVLAGATHWRVSFLAVGGALMALTLVLTRVPMLRPSQRAVGYARAYVALLRQRPMWLILGSNALERTVYGAATTYLPPFLIQQYDLSLGAVAPVLAITAVGSLVGNLAGGRASARVPPALLFALCQGAAGAAGLLILGLAWPLALAGALIWLFGAFNAYSRPTFLSLVMDLGATARGSMLGILSTTNQGGITLGAAAGGLALAVGGYAAVGVLIAGLGLGAALLALWLSRALVAARPRDGEPADAVWRG
ncbi:MAG: MFS transporter [Chloroflexi bacterium]|nr:MFS transporter [Chloroflexota bacterium]